MMNKSLVVGVLVTLASVAFAKKEYALYSCSDGFKDKNIDFALIDYTQIRVSTLAPANPGEVNEGFINVTTQDDQPEYFIRTVNALTKHDPQRAKALQTILENLQTAASKIKESDAARFEQLKKFTTAVDIISGRIVIARAKDRTKLTFTTDLKGLRIKITGASKTMVDQISGSMDLAVKAIDKKLGKAGIQRVGNECSYPICDESYANAFVHNVQNVCSVRAVKQIRDYLSQQLSLKNDRRVAAFVSGMERSMHILTLWGNQATPRRARRDATRSSEKPRNERKSSNMLRRTTTGSLSPLRRTTTRTLAR